MGDTNEIAPRSYFLALSKWVDGPKLVTLAKVELQSELGIGSLPKRH